MRRPLAWRGYVAALTAVGAITGLIGVLETRTHVANISMLYLIVVLAAATLAGHGPAFVASVAAFLAFNWFFVEPLHTFSVGDPDEWFALVLFLITAAITGQLAAGQRDRAREAAEREREATLLYEVARVLSESDLDEALATADEKTARARPLNPRLAAALDALRGSAIERARLRTRATENEVLRRADELKSALLGAVSHDLRTPLASIIASAGSLRQPDVEWSDVERSEFLADIETEARRLSRIVANLLDLSRMESGTLRPERGWYDLGALVDDVLGRLRPVTRDHHIHVTARDDMPPVPLDYVEMDQVLSNLVENAARHTPTGTDIWITVDHDDRTASVEIADNGPGVPETALEHIFDPFVRLASRRGSKDGTGLGLAIARGLVEAHGGHISVGPRSAGGAVFRFTLPLAMPDPANELALSE